jgi:hypothetical protein
MACVVGLREQVTLAQAYADEATYVGVVKKTIP